MTSPRRILLAAVLAAAVCTAAAGCGADESATDRPLDKVTYLTAFGAVGRDAFAWVAEEKGYFREAGFDVTIQLGAAAATVNQLLFPAYAKLAGFDHPKVTWVNAAPPQVPALLASGRVDAVVFPYSEFLEELFGNVIMRRAQPAADKAAAVGEITLMTPYVNPGGGTFGAVDRERVERAIAVLRDAGLIPPGLTADQVIDFDLTPTA